MEEIEDKQQEKNYILETLFFMVPICKQLGNVSFDVTYKYDVYTKVLNVIIANKYDNKVKGNN